MSDLIDRQAVLDAVNNCGICIQKIMDLPQIDSVPVIRCKDCKYWNGSGKFCDYEMSGLENDFCSWAERRENETD